MQQEVALEMQRSASRPTKNSGKVRESVQFVRTNATRHSSSWAQHSIRFHELSLQTHASQAESSSDSLPRGFTDGSP